MATTFNLGVLELVEGQAGAEVTVNEALELIDLALVGHVKNRTTTTPPSSPTVGDCYVVGASATDDWSGKDGQFAAFTNGGWRYFTPKKGFKIHDESDDHFYGLANDGSTWKRLDN